MFEIGNRVGLADFWDAGVGISWSSGEVSMARGLEGNPRRTSLKSARHGLSWWVLGAIDGDGRI